MNWYKTLGIMQRINLKELAPDIIGQRFSDIVKLLGFRETVNVVYNKLRMEGYDV